MAKSLDFYFKHWTEGQRSSLPASISQATIDAVEQELGATLLGMVADRAAARHKANILSWQTFVGEYAAKHGIAAAMRYFKQNKSFSDWKEAIVHGWKNLYLRELHVQSQGRKRDAPPVQIEVLPSKRRGRPLLLGEKWEDEVKSFVKLQWDKGCVVNTVTVMATAVGFVTSHDANLLAENGGHIDISKSWATRFLERMNMV